MFKIGDRVMKINSLEDDTSKDGEVGTIITINHDASYADASYAVVQFDNYKYALMLNLVQLVPFGKLPYTTKEGWGFPS